MKLACVITAAGQGLRSPGAVPKQYRKIAGQAVLARSIRAMLSDARVAAIQCVIDPDHRPLFDAMLADQSDSRLLPPVYGGATRTQSVCNGLIALETHAPDRVLIHDAARPFVPLDMLVRVIDTLHDAPAVLPAIPVTDTIWRRDGDALTLIDRRDLWRAQTPQGFDFKSILSAHRSYEGTATDDIAVARAAGMAVRIVEGAESNYKLTTEADFARAERELAMDIRTGTGFDVHAFGEGNRVILCGVEIGYAKSLQGHSDADVAMHAITDAILGALAEGDIGQWFPPGDPQWKGAASEVFLRKAADLAREKSLAISHIDCTIICETPRIAPHAPAMRANIARICGVDPGKVSVKATTTEGLGFTGRSEGIAAMANATLVPR